MIVQRSESEVIRIFTIANKYLNIIIQKIADLSFNICIIKISTHDFVFSKNYLKENNYQRV